MSEGQNTGSIESREDFKNDERGQYQYWLTELSASQKMLGKWHKQSDKIVSRYIDDRAGTADSDRSGPGVNFRLNLFNSNVKTISSMLYGRLPKIEVSRRNASQNDDVGRVAAETVERLLALDLEDNGKEYDSVFRATLLDRLLPGLGCARVRYAFESEEVALEKDELTDVGAESYDSDNEADEDDEAETETKIINESAPIDYYHWSDVLWGWARTFSEVPWISFRSYLSKDGATERFSAELAEKLSYKNQKPTASDDSAADSDETSEWMKAEVWEIWDKAAKKVVWVSLGCDEVLDTKDDPLKLSGFYPNPPFFIANATTSLYKPTPDYHLAQDLYNEIDVLQTRISILTEAVKVVGVYDAASEDIQRIFNEGIENDLIPVDNWALFAERGGIKGSIDWVPIEAITNALDKLRALRDETIGLLQQTTGMADVMRGDLGNQYEGVGQSQIKAKFGSIRVQALQDEFAIFVTDLMQLKAEVIARHFSPETIIKQSNMAFSPDVDLLAQAVELIKKPEEARIRVNVRSETLAMLDYAQLREERTSYLSGLSQFLQAAQPLIQQDPRATPFLLEMLKWAMAGYKGASEVEGVLDKAIETMQQPEAQKQDKPDPEKAKAEMMMKLEQMRQQGKMAETQAKLQSDMQIREQDRQADIATRQAEAQFDMMKAQQAAEIELNLISAKFDADVQTELLTSKINTDQQVAGIQAQIEADVVKHRNKIEELRITKRADAGLKILEKRMDGENQQRVADAKPKPETK